MNDKPFSCNNPTNRAFLFVIVGKNLKIQTSKVSVFIMLKIYF